MVSTTSSIAGIVLKLRRRSICPRRGLVSEHNTQRTILTRWLVLHEKPKDANRTSSFTNLQFNLSELNTFISRSVLQLWDSAEPLMEECRTTKSLQQVRNLDFPSYLVFIFSFQVWSPFQAAPAPSSYSCGASSRDSGWCC